MKAETVILINVLGLVFAAAAFYTSTKLLLGQLRKDINGVGDASRQTYLKLMYVAMMIAPEEKRQEILNALVRRLT